MGKIYSAGDVAAERGVAPQTVTRVAAQTGIGQRISGVWAFTQDEKIEISARIRERAGNPNFKPGHTFGKGRKKSSRKSSQKAE